MAARPIWRGHLRLALVSCPIALHSVERASSDLHFHLINPDTGHRVRMVTTDAETEEEVSRRDLVKGYEFEKDRYVLMEDDDFERARIESSSTLTVAKFVDRSAIEPVYFDTSYYLAPDGDAGQDVFVVLRDAIAKTGKAALSRVVIGRRERPVAILPMGKGMVCYTLHEPRELYSADELFDPIEDVKPDPEMVKLATQLIERQEGQFTPEDSEDRYETRLREVIDAKLRGEGIEPEAEEEPDRGNVIDLMAALKQSLGRGGDGERAAPPDARRGARPATTEKVRSEGESKAAEVDPGEDKPVRVRAAKESATASSRSPASKKAASSNDAASLSKQTSSSKSASSTKPGPAAAIGKPATKAKRRA